MALLESVTPPGAGVGEGVGTGDAVGTGDGVAGGVATDAVPPGPLHAASETVTAASRVTEANASRNGTRMGSP